MARSIRLRRRPLRERAMSQIDLREALRVAHERIEALMTLTACYRTMSHPTEKLLDRLDETRVAWDAARAALDAAPPLGVKMGALEAALRGLACRCNGDTEGHEAVDHLTPSEHEVYRWMRPEPSSAAAPPPTTGEDKVKTAMAQRITVMFAALQNARDFLLDWFGDRPGEHEDVIQVANHALSEQSYVASREPTAGRQSKQQSTS